VAFIRKRLGLALLEVGRLEDADRELGAAYRQVGEGGPTDVKGELELLLGRVRLAQGDPEGAWTLAARGLAAQELITGRFQSLDDQRRFLADKLAAYRTAFGIALAGAGPAGILRAWSVAERAKSFYLCQLVRNGEVGLFVGVDPAMVARLEELERAIDVIDRKAHDRPEPDGGAGRAALYGERQGILGEIMRANQGWGALQDPRPLDVAVEMSRLRAQGWVPVSYFWQGASMHVFSCDATGAPVHLVEEWSASELEQLRAARARLVGEVSQSARLMPRALVSKLLPPALRASWPAGAPVLFSPHGDVHLLPLHALGREGERLCDERASQYIPTLGLLRDARSRPAPKALLALGCVSNGFGDPELHDVAPEIDGIEGAWAAAAPGTTTARLLGPDDDLDAVGAPLGSWDGYRYLHLSCHGHFPEGRPFDAALRLGTEALRGSELFGARLSARLVTLSACEVGRHASGEGSGEAPDEWLGLYLPLFYAGAGSLLVSLWVADARPARLLMVALHARLAAGDAPAAAFRAALDAVKERPEAQWANWYLVGVPCISTIDERKGDS
jgi:hypothetical protein